MPLRSWLKPCWQGARFCTHCIGTVLLWTLWLALGLTLGLLAYVASVRELAVPDFILRQVERRLAADGLHAALGRARFDPHGRVLIQDLRIYSRGIEDPLLTARGVALNLDPWSLLLRTVELDSARVTGASLHVPAMMSLSGQSEPLVHELDVAVHLDADARHLTIDHLTARFGPVPIVAHGTVQLPPRSTDPEAGLPGIRRLLTQYPRMSRRLSRLLATLPPLERPGVVVRLTPTDTPGGTHAEIEVAVAGATVPPSATLRAPLSVREVAIRTTAELAPGTLTLGPLEIDVGAASAPAFGRADHAHVRLHASVPLAERRFQVEAVEFAAAAVQWQGLRFDAPLVTLTSPGLPALNAAFTTSLAGGGWHAEADLDFFTRSGDIRVAGEIDHRLVAFADRFTARDLGALLQFEQRPRVEARIALGFGGRLRSVTGHVASGPVVARGVALDSAGARFTWRAPQLRFDDIVLRTGPSEARGGYEMDTDTLDFRFLLQGRLEPPAIAGWFRDWWTNFWRNFEFEEAPPDADVEVKGRWREPHRTTVFVAADAAPATVRGARFDRLRTRLFIRPEWVDALEFHGEQGGRQARGTFARSFDLRDRQWRHITFNVRSDLPVGPVAGIFGELGEKIAAPFLFTTPPRLHARGRLDGPASPLGRHEDVSIEAATDDPMTFHLFPLEHLRFAGHLVDDTLMLEDVRLGFARGIGTGRAEVRGLRDGEQRLAFDLALEDAHLGEGIRTLELFSALRRGEPPPPVSRFQRRSADGTLDLALSAEGRYRDLYSFAGEGSALVTGAEFAEINLLGVLSGLLRRTALDFTTLQLDRASANFRWRGEVLRFSELSLSGPRAVIESAGDYQLRTQELAFNTKIRPFDASDSLLGSAASVLLAPLSNAFEVRLTGQLSRPNWAFVYGPTNFLRNLSSPSDHPPAPSPLRH